MVYIYSTQPTSIYGGDIRLKFPTSPQDYSDFDISINPIQLDQGWNEVLLDFDDISLKMGKPDDTFYWIYEYD